MQLISMRHGVAVEASEWKGDDHSRPLTPEGIRKTRQAARGLSSVCDAPKLIASSPKIRALQTAELVQSAWQEKPALETWPELASDDFALWLKRLGAANADSVLLVGHEPDLSRFVSRRLLFDANTMNIEWKKAGALALDLDAQTNRATLLWMLPPRVLRLLAPQELNKRALENKRKRPRPSNTERQTEKQKRN